MDTNIVRDIANIYAEQVAINEALRSREERMARMVTPAKKKEQERTRQGRAILADIQATETALNAPKPTPQFDTPAAEVRKLKPGQKIDTLALKAKKAMSEAKKVKKWFDDDGDGIGYEEGEVSGKFKKKKKVVKEGFSNWREDLVEVMDTIEKEENEKEITEKKVKNKIKINPNMGEAVENLGGTLLEMTEIEDFEEVFDELSESDIFFLTDDLIEEVVEEVFIECIQEGYDIFEIENTLLESLEVSSALLNEAKVTYGHDTDIKSDRLEKVKSAVKNVGKKLVRGAGYVAGAAVRGAKAVGRELRAGYQRGRYGSGGGSQTSSSGSSDSGGGSATVTQGSGDSQASGSSRPGLFGRIGSALKRGLKKVVASGARAVSRGSRNLARRLENGSNANADKSVTPDTKSHPRSKGLKPIREPKRPPSVTSGGKRVEVAGKPKKDDSDKKVSVSDVTSKKQKAPEGTPENPRVGQPGPEKGTPKIQTKTTAVTSKPLSDAQKQAAMRAVRRNPNISKSDIDRITSSISEAHFSLATGKVEPGKPGEAHKSAIQTLATTATSKKKKRKPVGTSRRSGPFKPSSPEEAEQLKQSWGEYWSTAAKGYKEQYEILEKAESEQQQKLFGLALSVKRGETPRSEASPEVLKIVDSMSEKKIRDFAKTSHQGLPKKVQTKEEAIRESLLDRMFEKIDEQALEMQLQNAQAKLGEDFETDTMNPQELQLRRQEASIKKRLADIRQKVVRKQEPQQQEKPQEPQTQNASYEPEGELVDEAKISRAQRKASNANKKGYDAQGNPIERESKTQVIHDVDDNLADQRHPDAAKIDVLRKTGDTWEKVKSLTPSQFAHHKLRGPGESVKEQTDDPGDKYGFDQFKDTKLFKKTTKPNKPVVRLGDSPRRPASKAVVTARGPKPGKPSTPMNDTRGFIDDLRTRIGVKGLKRKDVHFTGGMSKGSGPEKKGKLVKKIVKPDAKTVITTDDHLQNLRHMASAASNPDRPVSRPKVKAYQAKPATRKSGKVKVGDIVPVRVGKEGDLNDPKIGIRKDPTPPSSNKENQRRAKRAKRGMRSESYDDSGFRHHARSITSSSTSSGKPSKTASLIRRMRELEVMPPSPKKKKKKKKTSSLV